MRTLLLFIFSLCSSFDLQADGNNSQVVTYTFTNCGKTGKSGPSGAQITAEYLGTNLAGLVATGWKAGYQRWVVPSSGIYWIEAKGARGGNSAKNGGGGTFVRGKFSLTAGQVLNIVVGQTGKDISGSYGASGGGGSFVVADTNNTPLIIAGGGGGAGGTMDSLRFSNDENGSDTADTTGGKNGLGGQGGRSGGGGGFRGNGGSYYSGQGGMSFQAGSIGGTPTSSGESGGFGGGGATHVSFWQQGGGGGGYSGGAGPKGDKGTFSEEGAGGGSFNAGTSQSIQVNANNGHGRVIIFLAEASTTPLTDSNFQTAVNLWFSDEANATATYGPIKDWNTSAVTNMQNAFFNRATFDENISGWDVSKVTNMYQMFRGAAVFNQNISDWNTSSVTNMGNMFFGTNAFNQPIGNWDVSKVNAMGSMFRSNTSFNQFIGNWDTSSVTIMGSMFRGASAFNNSIANWNVSSVANMSYLFEGASSFNQALNNWNTSSATQMTSMFKGANNFNRDISDWNVSNVTSMSNMLNFTALSNTNKGKIHAAFASNSNWPYDWRQYVVINNSNFQTAVNLWFSNQADANATFGHISDWNVSAVTDMSYAFYNRATFDENISGWDVSNVTDMFNALNGAKAFNQSIGDWNVSSVTSMRAMLAGTDSFNQPIGGWDLSNVTNMREMFTGAKAFNQPIGNWNVSSVGDMYHLFQDASAINQDIGDWNISSVTNMGSFFLNANSLSDANKGLIHSSFSTNQNWPYDWRQYVVIDDSNFQTAVSLWFSNQADANKTYGHIRDWNVSQVTDMSSAFLGRNFDENISGWDVSSVTNMQSLFHNSPFNQPIGNWNVSSVSNMISTFDNAGSFNHNVGDWNVSAVTNMSNMFNKNYALSNDNKGKIHAGFSKNQNWPYDWRQFVLIDDSNFQTAVNLWFSNQADANATYGHIKDWNTSAVTNMAHAFQNRSNFNEDIGNWDVSQVTNMQGMFNGAETFNQNIADWNTSLVENMMGIFSNTSAFNQDIGKWNISSVTHIWQAFRNASAFNQDIGDWNMSSVRYFSSMFKNAISFNQNISNWEVSKTDNFSQLFAGANSFNQDISDWNVSADANMTNMFLNTSALSNANKGKIHTSFSTNSNWPYPSWSAHVVTLDTGLVARYDFDGNQSEFTRDKTGNGRDGNLTGFDGNSGGQVKTPWSNGAWFDRNSSTLQAIILGNDAIMENLQEGNYSLSAWYYALSLPESGGFDTSHGIIVKPGWHMGLAMDNLGRFRSRQNLSNNTAPYPTANQQLPVRSWHHATMVVSWANSSILTYVDGSLVKNFSFQSGLTSMEMGSEPWNLGSSNVPDYPAPADGVLDNVRFYSRALASDEVQKLYQGELPSSSTWLWAGIRSTEGGKAKGSGTYLPGSTIRIQAVPEPDWVFVKWTGTGISEEMSSQQSLNFTIQNPVDLRAHFHLANRAPVDLNSTSSLVIAENQPVGTFVGQFSANDPDANATLSYRFASGAGSQQNNRFTLDANGTLRTSKVFDYENLTSFKIRVQVADEHNASIKQAFIVSVTNEVESNDTTGNPGDSNATNPDANATQPGTPLGDLFQPIVETGEAKRVQKDSATLRGSLIDNGGARITGRGFLLSERPNPKPDRQNVTRLDANGSKNFQAQAANLKAGKKYYFRAFARNAQGTALGSVESFTTIAGPPSPSWINAQPGAAANWWTSPWFGNFYLNTNGWIRHEQLGWAFPMESPTAGLWLWKRDLGWLWTDKEIYPFLYQNAQGGWLYFYGQRKGTLLFYDYEAKGWISREDGQ